MALRYCAACIEQAGDGYSVVFPDLPGCVSAGATVQDAAVNAAEALAMHIEGMAEDRQDLPAPTPVDAPLPHWLVADGEPEFVARILVPVEMPGRAVRANITMEEGLLRRVDAAAAAGASQDQASWPRPLASGWSGLIGCNISPHRAATIRVCFRIARPLVRRHHLLPS